MIPSHQTEKRFILAQYKLDFEIHDGKSRNWNAQSNFWGAMGLFSVHTVSTRNQNDVVLDNLCNRVESRLEAS
jgi:hypothetical protein